MSYRSLYLVIGRRVAALEKGFFKGLACGESVYVGEENDQGEAVREFPCVDLFFSHIDHLFFGEGHISKGLEVAGEEFHFRDREFGFLAFGVEGGADGPKAAL